MDRKCPACGGGLASWITARSAEPGSEEPILLLRCGACGSAVTLTPAPPDAHDSGAYATARPRLSVALGPLLRWFDRRRLARLGAPSGARLLDVGAGRGRFVATARANGFQAGGIEPSRRGVTAAASEYGVELQRGTLAEADVERGTLQAVTLWHVLEHLDDPGEALEAITGWLEPDGLLLVAVPNLASLQARIGGPRWYHLDLPRHRTHFTATGLEMLLRRQGFEPLRTSHLVAEQNLYGMWQTLVNRFTRTPSYLYNMLKRNAPARSPDLAVTVAFLPMTVPAALLELAAGLARRGGTITVLARPAPARRL
jgi:2-polyprenyl-3-methyl-5-hydroxy-6-metoxy-1,4-benzoquinol methylase